MSLTSVKMSEEVWLTCLTHALSTETEEIMGLLLGDIEIAELSKLLDLCLCSPSESDNYSKNGSVTAIIWGAAPQTRSDRRKDRVETNPEQLAAASAQAERMSVSTGKTTRVIGWYHSHPHITVLPSHVDVRTQAMYQLLDSGFVGLIFSCFSEDANKVGRIQVIAFQSSDGKQNNMTRPLSPSPINKSFGIESSLSSLSDASIAESPEKDSGHLRAILDSKSSNLGGFFANVESKGIETSGINNSTNNVDSFTVDMDMSESIQEAVLRSNLDMSGAEYIRKEIPLQVLPASSLLKLESPLMSFLDLQRVIYEEEHTAYTQAMNQNMRDEKVHPLAFIHHTSTYQASMCKLIEYCLSPAINALQDRLRENEIRLMLLKKEAKVLELEASRVIEPNVGSPSGTFRTISGTGNHSRRSS